MDSEAIHSVDVTEWGNKESGGKREEKVRKRSDPLDARDHKKSVYK